MARRVEKENIFLCVGLCALNLFNVNTQFSFPLSGSPDMFILVNLKDLLNASRDINLISEVN